MCLCLGLGLRLCLLGHGRVSLLHLSLVLRLLAGLLGEIRRLRRGWRLLRRYWPGLWRLLLGWLLLLLLLLLR